MQQTARTAWSKTCLRTDTRTSCRAGIEFHRDQRLTNSHATASATIATATTPRSWTRSAGGQRFASALWQGAVAKDVVEDDLRAIERRQSQERRDAECGQGDVDRRAMRADSPQNSPSSWKKLRERRCFVRSPCGCRGAAGRAPSLDGRLAGGEPLLDGSTVRSRTSRRYWRKRSRLDRDGSADVNLLYPRDPRGNL